MLKTDIPQTATEETVHPVSYRPYIILNTTQRCNLRCRMCFWSKPEVAQSLRKHDPTMPMSLYQRALEESVPYGRALCLAGGGEFLADPVYEERLQHLGETLRRHPEIMLYQTTNGTLLSDETLGFLRGVKKVGMTLSIDTLDTLTYASIRRPGGLSGVESTIRGLRKQLHALGLEEIHLRLNMVIMKRNIFSIPEVLRFAKQVGAVVFVDHPQGFGPDDLHRESLFRYPVFTNVFLAKCQKLADSLNVEFQRPPAFAVEPHEIEAYHAALNDRQLSCYQLDREGPVQIDHEGNVSVCCQNLVFGNLKQQAFKEIFFSPRYTEYRTAIAQGKPLAPCDRCRHLYRSAPYLYDAMVYGMDIPLAERNMALEPDFEREGFFDWLSELSERQIRHHLHAHYLARAKHLSGDAIDEELADFERSKQRDRTFLTWIRNQTRVLVYPAGKQSGWLLRHSLLAEVDVIAVADRNPVLHGKKFYGKPVVPPTEIVTLAPDVIFVASDIHQTVILQELAHMREAGIEIMTL